MQLRRRLLIFIAAGVLAAAAPGEVYGQATEAPPIPHGNPATDPLDTVIPPDPQVRIGTLDNGLRYYVRRNGRPENRAELRLVVNAGSVLEDDDQRGLAHFVEHMAFNGTEHFPKLEIVAFMESIGMRFGPSVNAFTSFDETVYMLQVPTDDEAVVDRALLILEDWAHRVTFDPEEVDRERGVVIEEWRGRRGAAARLQDQQIPVLLEGSRYAERLPIGTLDVLEHFSYDRLVQFYRDWYRPDLMAVIAVGDFDPVAMEARIRDRFARIPAATGSERPRHEVPERQAPAYLILTDPEQTVTQVRIDAIGPARDLSTIGGYRESIVENLFVGMLSARFDEITRDPDAPLLAAGAGRSGVVRPAESQSLVAVVRDGEVLRGAEALFVEAARAARFGFTEAELDRQKRIVSRSLERAVAERDTQQSSLYAAEYSRHFLEDEPIPGIVYEQALHARFLPEITLEEVNAIAARWSPADRRIVMVTAPEKDDAAIPTVEELAAVIASAPEKATEAWTESTVDGELMAEPPAPGAITASRTLERVGITEWTLSNGARVVLMPTMFKQDQIVFRAFSDGGSSLAPDELFVPASTAAQVVAAGGVGPFSSLELRRKLAGVVASVTPSIGTYEEGLSGFASPKDLETLFQLIHLRFTEPRADEQMFRVMQEQTRAALANQSASPEYVFSEAINDILTQGHPRGRTMTVELVDEMDLDASMAFYRDRFADAGDFTFVFVGSFDPDTMRPLVERYLATLPSTGRVERWRDIGLRPPSGVVERTVHKGLEPRSLSRLIFHGDFQYDQQQRAAIRAMGSVLQTRLRNVLREELGGTYSVGVSVVYSHIPRPEYRVTIGFGSAPDRARELQERVLEEVERFRRDGPSEREVSDVREAMLREVETGMQDNSYLLTQIVGRYRTGESVEGFFEIEKEYRALTAAVIREAARRYLEGSNLIRATLLPADVPAP